MSLQTNILHCGDNLEIMRSLPDASIDLICTDPPFNTGRDFGEFNDKWENGLDGYLAFMKPRLERMHELLKDTGSFYLHCDPTASHYLKVLLDTVFGIKQFRNEIIWGYDKMGTARRCFRRGHDVILFYVISNNKYQFNMLLEPITESMEQDRQRGYHSHGDALTVYDSSNPKAQERIKSGRYKKIYYTENLTGKLLADIWDIYSIGSTANERVNYPTQKPVALLDRIISASSNAGDIVLDPFCGSGTTLVSANNLSRYYIGIDKNPQAIKISESRLQQLNLFTSSNDEVSTKENRN